MLRIARTKKSTFLPADKQDAHNFSQYQPLTKLIKKYLSPVTASIFSKPVLIDNSEDIEWYSDLQGQPQPLLSLPEDQQLNAKKLLTDRLAAISKLADQLPQLESDSEALQSVLRKAIQFPGYESIYVVNGEPVITFWGIPDPAVQAINSATPVIPPAPILNQKPKRKISRLFSYLAWLLLVALLAALAFWISKQPINWQDYNPFIDEYQILLDEVNAAEENCSTLKAIYNDNPLINKDEEKFILLKQSVKIKLTQCDYQLLLDEVNAAGDSCPALKKVYNSNPLINKDEEKFILLKQQVEAKLSICTAYEELKKEIELAQGDCEKLSQILNTNTYLKNPDKPFIQLKQDLEKNVQLCAEYNKLKSEIDTAKDDCALSTKINAENPFLQKPEGMFISLKQQIEKNIQDCNAYQSLSDSINKAQLDCATLKKLSTENQSLQNPGGKYAALKQQLNKYQKSCKRKKIENIVNLCPGQRPKKLAPELVVVFDASGSMAFPSTSRKTKTFERQMQQGMGQRPTSVLGILLGAHNPGLTDQQYKAMVRRLSPPNASRMNGAKLAVKKLVQKTPSDMNIGLVVLKECHSAKKYRFYTPSQRKTFMGIINRLRPTGGTPLGDAIHKAGQMIDGVNKPATIVVISDGEESCKSKSYPCSVARKLAARKPYLTINVVDILGTGAGNCIARATKKGKVYTARSMQEIVRMTEKAASTAIPKNCK